MSRRGEGPSAGAGRDRGTSTGGDRGPRDESDGSAVRERVERIEAGDGFRLALTLIEPVSRRPAVTCLIAPAIGASRVFYHDWARWLAERGMAVAVPDYRGIGGSRPLDLAELDARMLDLARLDLPAAADRLAARHPGSPRIYVGHSLGAQLFGLLPDPGRYRRMLMVASGSAYWRLWPAPTRWGLLGLWYVGIPVLTRLFGHFPAGLVGLGEDLPPGVARDWARWARHPAYTVDDEGRPIRRGFRAYRGRIRALSFSDDPFAPKRAAEELLSFWERADREMLHRTPGELGLERVGHLGFFRVEAREPLWRESAAWLLAAADRDEPDDA